MNKDVLIRLSFFIYLMSFLVGTYLKITHQGGDMLFMITILFAVVFVVAAILEVQRSPYLARHQKTFWTLGFILSSGIAGLVYMALVRKKVVRKTL